MRYLGKVFETITENCFEHLKFLLQKEVVLRCFKHIFNEGLRESSEFFLSKVVSHFLNCFFSSSVFLKKLDQNQISYQQPQPQIV